MMRALSVVGTMEESGIFGVACLVFVVIVPNSCSLRCARMF